MEGVADSRVHLVGNVMIDTLLKNRTKAEKSKVLEEMQLEPRGYATMTLHRPSNVDEPVVFRGILDAIEAIQRDLPIVFPIHPRTLKNLDSLGLQDRVASMSNLRLVDPIGYLDFLKLNSNARLILTDSGGLQEEATILRVPCITIREKYRATGDLRGWGQSACGHKRRRDSGSLRRSEIRPAQAVGYSRVMGRSRGNEDCTYSGKLQLRIVPRV